MPMFQDDFVNHMGLFPECGSERIEKCFSQTSQTLSNSVPISISSVEGFYSLGLVSLITAEAHFALFCFYLRQNLYSHLKIFISRKPFFYCDNSVRLWATWILWTLDSSQKLEHRVLSQEAGILLYRSYAYDCFTYILIHLFLTPDTY